MRRGEWVLLLSPHLLLIVFLLLFFNLFFHPAFAIAGTALPAGRRKIESPRHARFGRSSSADSA